MIKIVIIFLFLKDLQQRLISIIELTGSNNNLPYEQENEYLKTLYKNISIDTLKKEKEFFKDIKMNEIQVITKNNKQSLISSVAILNGIFKKEDEIDFDKVDKKMDFLLEEYNIIALQDEDMDLLDPEISCPILNTIKKDLNEENVMKIEKELSKVYKELNLSEKFKNLTDFENFLNYSFVQNLQIKKEIENRINFINTFKILHENYYDRKLSLFYINNIFRNITSFIDENLNKFGKKEEYIKYLLYSTSSQHIYSFLNFFGVTQKENFEFEKIYDQTFNQGNSVKNSYFLQKPLNLRFELHLNNNNFEVQIFYGEKNISFYNFEKLPLFFFRRKLKGFIGKNYFLFCQKGLEIVDKKIEKKSMGRIKLSYVIVATLIALYTVYQRIKKQKMEKELKIGKIKLKRKIRKNKVDKNIKEMDEKMIEKDKINKLE